MPMPPAGTSKPGAVTPSGVRDGDPQVLAALCARRGEAVLAFARTVCPPEYATRAAADAFARFRATVAGDGELDLHPDALLLRSIRRAALDAVEPGPDLGCAPARPLLAARAERSIAAGEDARLTHHLKICDHCRDISSRLSTAETAYRDAEPRPVEPDATAAIVAAMAAAAPIRSSLRPTAANGNGAHEAKAVVHRTPEPEPEPIATEPEPEPEPEPVAIEPEPEPEPRARARTGAGRDRTRAGRRGAAHPSASLLPGAAARAGATAPAGGVERRARGVGRGRSGVAHPPGGELRAQGPRAVRPACHSSASHRSGTRGAGSPPGAHRDLAAGRGDRVPARARAGAARGQPEAVPHQAEERPRLRPVSRPPRLVRPRRERHHLPLHMHAPRELAIPAGLLVIAVLVILAVAGVFGGGDGASSPKGTEVRVASAPQRLVVQPSRSATATSLTRAVAITGAPPIVDETTPSPATAP